MCVASTQVQQMTFPYAFQGNKKIDWYLEKKNATNSFLGEAVLVFMENEKTSTIWLYRSLEIPI